MRSWLRLTFERVERVALIEAEFAPDDLVARGRIAGDVDPLDINARRVVRP